MDKRIISRKVHASESGELSELFSSKDIKELACAHSYFVSINPGHTRARHYHNKKFELICPAYGRVEVLLEDPKTKKRERVKLSAEERKERKLLLVPMGVAHAVKNASSKKAGIVVFSSSFDLEDTISYGMEVSE